MDHGNHAPTEDHYGEPGAHHEAVVLDPENDIDARSATIWFIAGAIVLFISLWLMLPIFVRVQEEERIRKVDEAPNVERQLVEEAEHDYLNGQNPSKKSIEQVMRQMAGK
jgi:hypothetical protein